MKLFIKSKRNGQDFIVSYDGQTLETVMELQSSLGCTDIEQITEEQFQTYVSQD